MSDQQLNPKRSLPTYLLRFPSVSEARADSNDVYEDDSV